MDATPFSPTIALLTLSRAAEVEVARILEPAGLSVRKLAILRRLAAVPGASPADLARVVSVNTDEAGPLLRALTSAGLVKSGRDSVLSITPAGAAALERVAVQLEEVDARLFAGRDALSGELFAATTEPQRAPQD